MEAATLADQFRDLQLKQHERFKARVARLQAKQYPPQQQSDSASPPDVHVDGASCLIGDLGLMTATQERELGSAVDGKEDKSTHRESAENDSSQGTRVRELSQKVEQLLAENERLTSRLKTSERKVEAVERTLQTEREALGGGPTAAQKIVELSKKNRVLHAELAAEKNRVRQLEKAARAAVQPAHPQQEVHEKQSEKDVKDGEEELRLELREVQEQLTQAKSKAADLSNQCQQLRHDLKMAHRVITREVGEGVTVGSLLNGQSGWRGRSQQIIILQSKLSQMKSSLEKCRNCGMVETSLNIRESGGEGRAKARQRAALEKMERERRENLETVRRELEKVQRECEQFRKECSALRARNKTLTEELKLLRSGPASGKKRNQLSDRVFGDSAVLQELEQRMEKLEETNRNLRQELGNYKRALHQSQQKTQQTRCEAQSLPPLVHQPRHPRPRSRMKLDRQTLSAGTPVAAGLETSSLREAQMMKRLAETERDRLLELTTTLQQRLASTEEQLVRLKTERVASRPPTLTRGGRKQPHSATGGPASERLSALESELAIQRDENSVLRETLAQLRREKLEDARLLHSTLQDARRRCLEVASSHTSTAHLQ